MSPRLLLALAQSLSSVPGPGAEARSVSGIYPHLALYNDENECGIGGVVEWAGRLWAITYAPHAPRGSSDRLYSMGTELDLVVHPESVGGTPACRMIHRETEQLVLGPYVIDAKGAVRVIPPERMPGRLTGVARHLIEPERRVYFATMEEGLYDVDLVTLEVTELYADDQGQLRGDASERRVAKLPGTHGKGLYSGQGRLVYANNGEPGAAALERPDVPSGCLAEWDGEAWRVVRRNQFTEVTGPGSLMGNLDSESDPVWSIGWDHRSLVLMVLDAGEWHAYRLPKASHAYDGAHGWNTEWPRIRDVGEPDLLMTMHGAFWSFPRGFSARRSAGIAPLSTYLKVVGDFARFGERLVLGCDDVARSEFLNRRRAKGALAAPGQSHSNLWFLDPADLTRLGPALGRGAVWIDEPVAAETWSEPYLFGGFLRRGVHLAHDAAEPVTFHFEVDRAGDGRWSSLLELEVPERGHVWHAFSGEDDDRGGAWIRVSLDHSVKHATAAFHASGVDPRSEVPAPIFAGLATRADARRLGGLMRARGDGLGTLAVVASTLDGADVEPVGFYELTPELRLEARDDPAALAWHRERTALPAGILDADAASLVYVDDDGRRWRLPRGPAPLDPGPARVCREVVTERDLFHAGGTFYELPARNAGGFARIRPIATHPFRIHDYAAFRGLLVLTGLDPEAAAGSHVVRSSDGRAAVWVGHVDDLWSLGKPRGRGGPWLDTPARPGEPSDPYLLTGFDEKRLRLEHDAPATVTFRLEVDVTGAANWHTWRRIPVEPGTVFRAVFPPSFGAYWLRVTVDEATRATAQLDYR